MSSRKIPSGFEDGTKRETETIDLNELLDALDSVADALDVGVLRGTPVGQLLHALPVPSLLIDQTGAIVFASQSWQRVNPNFEQIQGKSFSTLFPDPAGAERAQSLVDEVFSKRKTRLSEGIIEVGGNRIWARTNLRSLRIGGTRAILGLVEDMTAEKKQILLSKKYGQELERRVAERTEELVRINEHLTQEMKRRRTTEEKLRFSGKVMEASNEGVLITDLKGDIIEVNQAFCDLTGYSREDVIGQNPRIMKSDRHGPEFFRDLWVSLLEEGQWKGEVWDRKKNGEIHPKLLSISAIRNDQDEITHYAGIFSDITKMKLTEERLERLAHYDPLTELPNRMLFRDRLKLALLKAQRTGMQLAVLFLDLDRFKYINDTMGHPVGDQLLLAVAKRLTSCVRKSDTVARLGGDEFTIILEDFADMRSLAFLARKITARLAEPFSLDKTRVFVTASMGVALYPHDGKDVDLLIQNADTAMYQAKEQGKNRCRFFSEEMNIRASQRLELETSLRMALRNDEFVLYYQPQLELATGRVSGGEALIRWNHPQLGLMSPGRFIPVAEDTGLIVLLGEWVLKTACEQAVQWHKEGFSSLRVAVNVSGNQMEGDAGIQTVSRVLSETGIDPQRLELEMTESTLMADSDESVRMLHGFKKLGIRLSVDDFGTGYSSLSYLRRFPIDKLKVDRSFIKDISGSAGDKAIAKAIIALGHSLNLKVIAEGVETEEQLAFLKDHNCDEIQGFYFSRPLTTEAFADMLRNGGTRQSLMGNGREPDRKPRTAS
jgi:diguanylate cyclase (GGDEF)-like protein/PAS domain S-box-containing protein